MAIHVVVSHVIRDNNDAEPSTLLVDAIGVSGGDRCIELGQGDSVELWLGRDGKITMVDKNRSEGVG